MCGVAMVYVCAYMLWASRVNPGVSQELLIPKKVCPLSDGTSERHHSSGPCALIKLVCGFVNTFVFSSPPFMMLTCTYSTHIHMYSRYCSMTLSLTEKYGLRFASRNSGEVRITLLNSSVSQVGP